MLQGRNSNEPEFFKNQEAGYETREYWSTMIPGTGIIVTANAGDMVFVTNSLGMMGHIIKTYTQGTEKYPRLSDEPRFQALVQSSLSRANFVVWTNPQSAATSLRARAERWASGAISIDQKAERQRIDAKILRDQYGGRKEEDLSPGEHDEFEKKGEAELDALRKRVKEQQT